jgi:hypothetical protein
MNWDAIGAVAELLGALGVIISLLYLGTEVRSSSRATRQAAAQAIYTKLSTLHEGLANHPALADVWARGSKGLATLDEGERVQFSALMAAHYRLYEEMYNCKRVGDIDEWAWEGVTSQLNDVASTRGWAEWWTARGHWFSEDFQRLINQARPEQLRDIVADYPLELDPAHQPEGPGRAPA